jgi:hypothetical protein
LNSGTGSALFCLILPAQADRGKGETGASIEPSPAPSASPSASATAYRWPGHLAAGNYATSLSWDPSLVFRFTVPDGWESRDVNILKGRSMTVKFLAISNVVTDSCREHNRLWIMDVGRRIVLINAAWTDAASAADLSELQAVIDSVSLDTPLATPPPTPAGT